jgi:chloramphenicol-sensitive protein RarD
MSLLLVLAGPLTVLPLLFFAVGARILPLSIVGFMQYIAPSLQFIVGISLGETLTVPHLVCFGFIWTAIAVFSFDALYNQRRDDALV